MTDEKREELEKQAQGMLTEARRLIKEAGKLAKKGQFGLSFGEIGDFIPRSAFDRERYREAAIAQAKTYVANWDELDEEAKEDHLVEFIEEEMANVIPYAIIEYGLDADEIGDTWWHPSRC